MEQESLVAPPMRIENYEILAWAWRKRREGNGWVPHGTAIGFDPSKTYQPYIVLEGSTRDGGQTWQGSESVSYGDAFQAFWGFVDRAEPWFADWYGPPEVTA